MLGMSGHDVVLLISAEVIYLECVLILEIYMPSFKNHFLLNMSPEFVQEIYPCDTPVIIIVCKVVLPLGIYTRIALDRRAW